MFPSKREEEADPDIAHVNFCHLRGGVKEEEVEVVVVVVVVVAVVVVVG